MKDILLKLYIQIQHLLTQDEGQDLVEYALVVALISLGCVATMHTFAQAIGTAFGNVATTLNGATS